MGNGFLKVAVKVGVKQQINILAAIFQKDISVFVGELVQASWEAAKADGKVSDSMLAPIGTGLSGADVEVTKAAWESALAVVPDLAPVIKEVDS